MTKKQIQDWIEEYNNAIDYLTKLKEYKNQELEILYFQLHKYKNEIDELNEKIQDNYDKIKEFKKLLDLAKVGDENE